MNGFVKFSRSKAGASRQSIKLYRHGKLSISPDLVELIGSDMVDLYYNAVEHSIGIKAGEDYRLRIPPRQTSGIITVGAFMKHFNIPSPDSVTRLSVDVRGEFVVAKFPERISNTPTLLKQSIKLC